MLYDERKSVRDQAIQKILYYHDNLHGETRLRLYKKIEINFYCLDYVNMIDLDDDDILSEPPITKNIPYDYLKECLESENLPFPDPQIPCYIQGTERYVRLLTNVSRRVSTSHSQEP